MKNSFDKKNLKRIDNWLKDNKKIALATVIHTWGSSPQPIGSRMIVNENGDFSGSVSGGCIESSVIRECLEIIKKISLSKKLILKFLMKMLGKLDLLVVVKLQFL